MKKLVLIALVLAGCSGGDPSFHIDGTVRSVIDNSFIPQATMTFSWRSGPFDVENLVTSTDAGGHYSVDTGPTPCTAATSLTASAAGYHSFTTGVDCTNEQQQLDFALVPLN